MMIPDWQAEKEQHIRELQALRDEGHIDQEEFEELVEDMLDYGALSEDLEDEQVKIRIQQALDAVRALAGLL